MTKERIKCELNRCIQAKKRIDYYSTKKLNNIFDDFYSTDLDLFATLINKYMKELEEQDMKACKFCEGSCACHINPPCSFCTGHVHCEICDQLVCEDKAVEVQDKSDGSTILICPDCADKEDAF